jgi:hypothetical protein
MEILLGFMAGDLVGLKSLKSPKQKTRYSKCLDSVCSKVRVQVNVCCFSVTIQNNNWK